MKKMTYDPAPIPVEVQVLDDDDYKRWLTHKYQDAWNQRDTNPEIWAKLPHDPVQKVDSESLVAHEPEKNPNVTSYRRVQGKHDGKFTIVDNAILNDPEMSLEAKGLLAMMLQFPQGWVFHNGDLRKRTKSGDFTLRRALKELTTSGYVKRNRVRQADGTFRWYREVADYPKWKK